MTIQKGKIGVTTENIFPVIKNFYIATTTSSCAKSCQTPLMPHRSCAHSLLAESLKENLGI